MQDWMRAAKSLLDDPQSGFDAQAVIVSDTVEVEAPSRLVWDILLDMPRYSEWNPFCIRAVSTLEMGAAVEMMLTNYVVPGSLFPNVEYICALVPEELISWQLPYSALWPYPARRDQIIERVGANRCRYHSTDAFLGQYGIHVFRFAGPWVKRAFDDTARALKQRAEAMFKAGA